jgi:hypothetical protein
MRHPVCAAREVSFRFVDPDSVKLGHGAQSAGRRAHGLALRAPEFLSEGRCTLWPMCRSIRTLHNFEPPATDEEVHAAALQYVRKISGSRDPSRVNQEVFDRAVAEIEASTRVLVDSLVTAASPKNREVEAAKARQRSADRYR